ncbi:PQQ-dependent sugar dehydrogenase [Verticiella sediminum]|uniref:PQQ-dependent sugar dehydrogenase n=1 Tax=Verticiella sediminum TaxID=1247510 RepID=A0A556AYN0_9BURK|nr:PQQ-dependent sugar dehydrogenase [Verticiella sediminum]TSH98049.1 PQQ-dependent sugar dehydrogenase [Verticiella sediminum]
MPRTALHRAPLPDQPESATATPLDSAQRAAAVLTLVFGCSSGAAVAASAAPDAAQAGTTPIDTATGEAATPPSAHAETHASGFERPWSMAFLPDGGMLVTERPGRLRVVRPDGGLEPVATAGLPDVDAREHGGLLDIALDPAFASNRLFYFSYTEADAEDLDAGNGLVVARARLSEDLARAEDTEILFRQTPKVRSLENLGGRIAVSGDGHLFITLGDRRVDEERGHAQNPAMAHGKTLRIRTDGGIPDDNPFVGRQDALPQVWTLGHRNPQGAFVHPQTGELWIAEHGPLGGDEINIARKGSNYGWPVVSYGCEYDTCAPIGAGTAEQPGMAPPLTYWTLPSAAPSNLLIYTGDELPQWRDNLFVGGLSSKAVWRMELFGPPEAPRVVRREALFSELDERIRDVRQGPDGRLYLLTDGSEARVIRVRRATPPEG